jgi:hypothetical protein
MDSAKFKNTNSLSFPILISVAGPWLICWSKRYFETAQNEMENISDNRIPFNIVRIQTKMIILYAGFMVNMPAQITNTDILLSGSIMEASIRNATTDNSQNLKRKYE